MIGSGAVNLIKSLDRSFASALLKLFPEHHSLICFLFHGLFTSRQEILRGEADPQQRLTVEDFRHIIDYCLGRGYRIVSPVDVLHGLDIDGKYVLLTFDDGYYSSMRALPVLGEFGAPATFFISTNFVQNNRCFWWDVLWRESAGIGRSETEIHREAEQLKSQTNESIEALLTARLGERAFLPVGDLDRPMTVAELRDFAREKAVNLGNHTLDHAILTNYGAEAAAAQIIESQQALADMTGERPIAIAWPNGDYSDAVISAARAAGLRLGVTTEPRKNYLPLSEDSLMRLGRFTPIGGRGRRSLERQIDLSRSDVTLRRIVRRPRR